MKQWNGVSGKKTGLRKQIDVRTSQYKPTRQCTIIASMTPCRTALPTSTHLEGPKGIWVDIKGVYQTACSSVLCGFRAAPSARHRLISARMETARAKLPATGLLAALVFLLANHLAQPFRDATRLRTLSLARSLSQPALRRWFGEEGPDEPVASDPV